MRHKTPEIFWDPVPVKSAPGLEQLREIVIEHNENRMPKWKFRLADDLVVQIQPQLSANFRYFEGKAVECEDADNDAFRPGTQRRPGQTNLKFAIYTSRPKYWSAPGYTGQAPENHWFLKPESIGWAKGSNPNYGLRERLNRTLDDGFFDEFKPSMILSHHCMLCGKPLSDPASMARMIGPECYGSGSLNIPWLWKRKGAW
jgi:hypothetical protein